MFNSEQKSHFNQKENKSSTFVPKTHAMSYANLSDGLYFPCSKNTIVSRRTPTLLASSSCVKLYLALNSLILLVIINIYLQGTAGEGKSG